MFRRALFPTDFSAYATAVTDCLPELKAAGVEGVKEAKVTLLQERWDPSWVKR